MRFFYLLVGGKTLLAQEHSRSLHASNLTSIQEDTTEAFLHQVILLAAVGECLFSHFLINRKVRAHTLRHAAHLALYLDCTFCTHRAAKYSVSAVDEQHLKN